MKTFSLLGYNVYVAETNDEVLDIPNKCPDRIWMFAFDTETDTKIDMSKRDASNIDIMHDRPFLLQFGWNSSVYIVDFRLEGISIPTVLEVFDELRMRATLALAHNIKFDINMLYNIGYSEEFEIDDLIISEWKKTGKTFESLYNHVFDILMNYQKYGVAAPDVEEEDE